MIKIFYGDNRVLAKQKIEEYLGPKYEIIEGGELDASDLPNIFLGSSLFQINRSILIRDLSSNSSAFDELPKYLSSPHKIALFEMKLDKRTSVYNSIKDKVDCIEYKLPPNPESNIVFSIYNTAKKDGVRAISMLEKIKINQDPFMFMGLMTSQAIKDFMSRNSLKEKAILKRLSKLDMQTKNSPIEPWLLIEEFLLELSQLHA